MPNLLELYERQESLNSVNTQLENLMLSQSLLQDQINEVMELERQQAYLNSPLYVYNQLKPHLDTVITQPYDDSTGFNYPLYYHAVNRTLNLGYCHEYVYERRYTNGVLTHYQQFGTETAGDATLPIPTITVLNMR